MGNQLDEMNPVTMDEGRNINVIAKQIPVTLTSTENMIPTIMYAVGLVFALIGLFTMVFGGEAGGGLVFIAIGAIICFIAVSYTHLTLPTIRHRCRSRWSPYH